MNETLEQRVARLEGAVMMLLKERADRQFHEEQKKKRQQRQQYLLERLDEEFSNPNL